MPAAEARGYTGTFHSNQRRKPPPAACLTPGLCAALPPLEEPGPPKSLALYCSDRRSSLSPAPAPPRRRLAPPALPAATAARLCSPSRSIAASSARCRCGCGVSRPAAAAALRLPPAGCVAAAAFAGLPSPGRTPGFGCGRASFFVAAAAAPSAPTAAAPSALFEFLTLGLRFRPAVRSGAAAAACRRRSGVPLTRRRPGPRVRASCGRLALLLLENGARARIVDGARGPGIGRTNPAGPRISSGAAALALLAGSLCLAATAAADGRGALRLVAWLRGLPPVLANLARALAVVPDCLPAGGLATVLAGLLRVLAGSTHVPPGLARLAAVRLGRVLLGLNLLQLLQHLGVLHRELDDGAARWPKRLQWEADRLFHACAEADKCAVAMPCARPWDDVSLTGRLLCRAEHMAAAVPDRQTGRRTDLAVNLSIGTRRAAPVGSSLVHDVSTAVKATAPPSHALELMASCHSGCKCLCHPFPPLLRSPVPHLWVVVELPQRRDRVVRRRQLHKPDAL
eukprot:151317-Chlamydomonas_euryale.AAC.7